MGYEKIIPYSEKEHVRQYVTGTRGIYLYSAYPETLFNPIPYSSKLLSIELEKHRERPLIKIIFQGEIYRISYKRYDARTSCIEDGDSFTNYEHIQNYCSETSLYGRDVVLCKNTLAQAILGTYSMVTLINRLSDTQHYGRIVYAKKMIILSLYS